MFTLSTWLATKEQQKVVCAIKIASKEINACTDPDKRWRAIQELRKLQEYDCMKRQ